MANDAKNSSLRHPGPHSRDSRTLESKFEDVWGSDLCTMSKNVKKQDFLSFFDQTTSQDLLQKALQGRRFSHMNLFMIYPSEHLCPEKCGSNSGIPTFDPKQLDGSEKI